MTPKEKANELVKKFQESRIIEYTHFPRGKTEAPAVNDREAKECAIIAVDEIIKVTHSDSRANSPLDKEYWLKVKQELLNLKP